MNIRRNQVEESVGRSDARWLRAPFSGEGELASFFAAGGTPQQYSDIMDKYYGAYQVCIGVVAPTAPASLASAEAVPREQAEFGAGVARVSRVANVQASRIVPVVAGKRIRASRVVAMPYAPDQVYLDYVKAHGPAVAKHGDGYCYLYAIRSEHVDAVASTLGPRPSFRELVERFAGVFVDDTILARMRVFVEEDVGHVDPTQLKGGTTFLTLCRSFGDALNEEIVDAEFIARMRTYEPGSAVFVRSHSFVLGGEQQGLGKAFFRDLSIPIVKSGHRATGLFSKVFKFGELQSVVPQYVGMTYDGKVPMGEVHIQVPHGLGRVFLYMPKGALTDSGWVDKPVILDVREGQTVRFRNSCILDALMLSAVVQRMPDGVKVIPGFDDVDRMELVAAYGRLSANA